MTTKPEYLKMLREKAHESWERHNKIFVFATRYEAAKVFAMGLGHPFIKLHHIYYISSVEKTYGFDNETIVFRLDPWGDYAPHHLAIMAHLNWLEVEERIVQIFASTDDVV